MQKRILSNGTVLMREPAPDGVGHIYYQPAGPEGMVVVLDTHTNRTPVIAAALAWELDEEPPKGIDPKPFFNKNGFRY